MITMTDDDKKVIEIFLEEIYGSDIPDDVKKELEQSN